MSLESDWKDFLEDGKPKLAGIVVCLNKKQQFLIMRSDRDWETKSF